MGQSYKGPDPVTTEIIRNGFIAATEEMKTNLMRTAYNMIIYEALDFTVGLFDRHGNTVSIGLGLPMFIRGMSETIKAKLAHFGADGIAPGDVLLTNDAYTTGSHLNHMTFSVPIFHDDRLIGFSACMAHWQDIGGTLDGMTTDIFSEGLQMPIVKAWRAGVPNEEILSIIRMNVRLPERAMGDLKAQVRALGLLGAVHFIGYLDRDSELPDCYAAADVFVFASRTETQGLVLLEAMAAGLAVIALAEMGTIDILAPGRGAFCPPAEAPAFGEMLGHFLSHSEAWRHLAAEAPDYAAEWSDVAMASRLANLYRQLAGLKIASERPLTATA